MEAKELILRSLEESQGYLNRTLGELTQEEAAWSPKEECNSIAFIVWHLIRVEDLWINWYIRHEIPIYVAEGWPENLGTPAGESGYRYTVEQLQSWPVPRMELLSEYASAVRKQTLAFLKFVTPEKLSETASPDRSPDTIGAILSHLITEIALHVGQIDYLRGMLRGLDSEDHRYW